LEASHCGQRRRPRPPSADAPAAAPAPIDINTNQPRRWLVRYKKSPAQAAPVYFSLSEEECRPAWEKAQGEVSDSGLQLVEHEIAGWIARNYGAKKCVPCLEE